MLGTADQRSFIIEELIQTTEQMLQSVNEQNADSFDEAIRKRGQLFDQLGDLSELNSVAPDQQAKWMHQLQHLQKRDEDLRSLMQLSIKGMRHSLAKTSEEKKEIIGYIVKGSKVTRTA